MVLIPDQLRYALSNPDERSEIRKFILAMIFTGAILTTGGVLLFQKSNEAPPATPVSFTESARNSAHASLR